MADWLGMNLVHSKTIRQLGLGPRLLQLLPTPAKRGQLQEVRRELKIVPRWGPGM